MADTKSILIVGVGGQGTLLASKLVGRVLMSNGYDVKVSEVHGMSQRGGSVVTYVRYGSRVDSPILDLGEADCILSFELLEAARYLPYLKPGGVLAVNTGQIDPMPVITGAAAYPKNLLDKLRAQPVKVLACDALSLANQAGGAKAVNVVLVGLLARQMEFSGQDWEDAIRDTVPERFLGMNLAAFRLAYADGQQSFF